MEKKFILTATTVAAILGDESAGEYNNFENTAKLNAWAVNEGVDLSSMSWEDPQESVFVECPVFGFYDVPHFVTFNK